MKRFKKLVIPIYIVCFITLFFTFLYTFHVLPEGLGAPVILLIGFGLLIAGFFYFFFFLINDNENKIILRLNIFSENTITTILIVLMIITFFIPAITFSEMGIDWNQIPVLNYIRSIVFVIGCAFVPGSSIFCLLFPNSTIHEKLKIEPFFIKLVLYPLMSLTFLGSVSLILDQLGTMRENFSLILLLTLIFLHLFKIVKFRKELSIKEVFHKSEVKISRNTLFMLFLMISIIIISLSIHLHVRYNHGVDGYIAMSSSRFIGLPGIQITDIFFSYTLYWGYITFSLSTLSGIPAINIMVLYFFLIYLSFASIYLLFKALLADINDKYAILATIFAIIFTSFYLFYENNQEYDSISFFTYDNLFNLRYKGFGVTLSFVSMTLFIIVFKKSKLKNLKRVRFVKDGSILLVSAFFLIQSFMIYFLPIIPALSLIFVLMLVSFNKREQLKSYLFFSLFLVGIFILFDLVLNNFFSRHTISSYLLLFSELISFPIGNTLFKFTVIILLLISLLAIIPIISICFKKLVLFYRNLNLRIKLNPKSIIQIIIILYSAFFYLEILLNFVRTIRSLTYFTFILHLFYYNLGLTGILGIYLSILCYKKNKQIFYIAFIWFLCLVLISIIPIIIIWLFYPFLNPLELPGNLLWLYSIWFSRTWYYWIIPISILASIGLIKLIKLLSLKFTLLRKKKGIFLSLKLISLSAFVFFLFSNSIIAGMVINNEPWVSVNDEEMQVLGWATENLPSNSNILVDRRQVDIFLNSITTNHAYKINEVVETAILNLYKYDISYNADANCSIGYLEMLGDYENVIDLFDNNIDGQISVNIDLLSDIRRGSIQFLIKTTNTSKSLWLNSSLLTLTGFSLCLTNDSFFYFNGNNYTKIIDIENDKWYNMKIDFECLYSNYSGLAKNQWKATINGTEYGNFDFWHDIPFINYIDIFTSKSDSEWNTYITGLNFSWDSDFKFEHYIFRYLKVIDYLERKNVHFFISSKEPTTFRTEAEEFIDIDNDLILKFYKNKLYEYQDLALYSDNF
ncbi:MAG: hypothetical protein HWN81_13525 [Candidatus Lokiarchaeota archaeon]|nr:hypothetical protein [Candidatus Lokiarchaeota archaeon]